MILNQIMVSKMKQTQKTQETSNANIDIKMKNVEL